MHVLIFESKEALGKKAAAEGASLIEGALERQGRASVVLATGASQFAMMDSLVLHDEIDWSRVEAFHLDEYIGLEPDHPASFRRYLKERFIAKLPHPLRTFHAIRGESDPAAECARLGALIRDHTVDVAFVGIGENGHLAFNDPPADFETEVPFLRVVLDEQCRLQQVGEGWFARLDDVPREAVSMSIRQILKARSMICTVPDKRKRDAVKKTLEGPVTPEVPASILQTHPGCRFFLDRDSASLLEGKGYDSAQAP